MTEYKSHILNEENRVGFLNELGHDLVWGTFEWPDEATEEQKAEFEQSFEYLGDGHHTDGNVYAGTTFMVLIRRKSDGKLFGCDYWEGGGTDGERYAEDGHTSDASRDIFDEETFEPIETWNYFLPVELKPLPAYRFVEAEND